LDAVRDNPTTYGDDELDADIEQGERGEL